MRIKIYHMFVNRHAGIRDRYHRIHDKKGPGRRVLSYLYLLFLNVCYYVLFCRFLDEPAQTPIFEEGRLLTDESESCRRVRSGLSVEEVTERLAEYDIVSFDIFDTLLFRPFSRPADLFYFLAEKAGLLDLKQMREDQERLAREDCYKKKGQYEVTFWEIWERMEKEIGVPAEKGRKWEEDLESRFCYANPFMLEVFRRLREQGKKLIVISDMYLSEGFLRELLERNGYVGISRFYISCEWGCGKYSGELYRKVKEEYPGVSMIHVGDNEQGDVRMAKKSGLACLHYPNGNEAASAMRPHDMSPVIGGAYRGIVNHHLYNGTRVYSQEYEYGFIYGGLFAVGYCSFIHRYCREHQVDRLLFLSRDGDILKQVYDRMYPEDQTSYVYWSRAAAVKLMARYNHHDYFRRFLYHKTNQNISIGRILKDMELEELVKRLRFYEDRDRNDSRTGILLSHTDELTDQNVEALKRFIQSCFSKVLAIYREQDTAAKRYYTRELAGARRAVAVDIGWAGSGAMALSYLSERVWRLPCEIRGMVAGTNTVHNADPDASEVFLQSGKLISYLFSQSHNRDVMKKHDLNKDYNVYWELLVSSPTEPFLGFELDKEGKVSLRFGQKDYNQEGIRQIQRGILDFAEAYTGHFRGLPYMFDISGRDAYAPMLLAAGRRETYLKAIKKRFHPVINVN